MKRRKTGWEIPLFLTGVFLFFFVFYTRVSPIVVLNTDDWSYLALERPALPVWQGWNPSRVLPEILMPAASALGARVIWPLSGDFMGAVETALTLAVSLLVTVYAGMFLRLAEKKFGASRPKAVLMTVFFLIFHFLVFRTRMEGNDFLLRGRYDACTFFFYLVPALWNGALVMYLAAEDYFRTRKAHRAAVRAAVALAVYLAVFSNLFQSTILAAYTLVDLIPALAARPASGAGKSRWRGKGMHFSLLGLWVISLVFEFSGGRSESAGTRNLPDLLRNLGQAAGAFFGRVRDSNRWFDLVLAAALTVCVLRLALRRGAPADPARRERCREGLLFLLCGVCAALILLPACAASFPDYIARGDVMIGILLFVFLFLGEQILFLLEIDRVAVLAPLAALILAVQCMTPARTWGVSLYEGLDPASARRLTSEVVSAVRQADSAGAESVEVPVPRFNSGSNYPLANYGARQVTGTLYQYGVTRREIDLTFVPDEGKNLEYGIPLPE